MSSHLAVSKDKHVVLEKYQPKKSFGYIRAKAKKNFEYFFHSKKNKKKPMIENDKILSHNKKKIQLSSLIDPNNETHLPIPHMIIAANHEKLRLQNPGIIADAKAFSQKYDDINNLIKKITLSFSAKKNQSQFLIRNGIFTGARFDILIDNRNLSLNITNASEEAKNLVDLHKNILKNALANREINLKDIRFML